MKTTHLLKVLDREFSVVSSSPTEKVQAVEAFVNDKLQGISDSLNRNDQQLVLILALLNISEELLDLRRVQENESTLDDRLRGMLEKLQATC